MDKRGFGGSEYHTNKVLEAIEEYHSQMEYLVASAGSSKGALGSDSEGGGILTCS